jgi:CRISPR-associated exonuclease Cas4
MNTLVIISVALFIFGLLLLYLISRQNRKFGVLTGDKIYVDTDQKPGEILYSKTLNLAGKPDYLIKEGDHIFPVELKTGKTPRYPYQNHTMQLMAYCLLVEENFNVRPAGGYIKYPGKEFKIAYTEEAKKSLQSLVSEILEKKKTGEELLCDHFEHN